MKPKNLFHSKNATLGAAAAIFGLQQSADAAVIYTNPADVVVSPAMFNYGSAFIDLNGGGTDFVAKVYFHNSFGQIKMTAAGANAFLINAGAIVKLASGANISAVAGGVWVGGNSNIMRSGGTFGSTVGPWTPGQVGIAGVRLNAGSGNFNYGWIRMRVDDVNPTNGAPDRLTIFDYAYESTVNTPISAGDVGSIPEPSRALLALAGIGAMALRRKRKAA